MTALFFVVCQFVEAQPTADNAKNTEILEVVTFAAKLELEASHLKKGDKAVCVALDTRMTVREEDVVSKLKADGVPVHGHDWCNRGPRGFRVFVRVPVRHRLDEFEVEVEVGDLNIQPGEHFATLLKRGTYLIQLHERSEPSLVSYKKSCCPQSGGISLTKDSGAKFA